MENTRPIIFSLLLIMSFAAHGQVGNIVNKNISKSIPLKTGDVFKITGEKAYIKMNGWDKSYVEIKITFSAEHNDKSIALAELEYMHYAVSREKNIVELQNAFLLPARTDRIQSRVKVSFELMVPSMATFSIYDRFGDIEITDISGTLSLQLEFSDLLLNNVSGKLNVRSSYSAVRGEALSPVSFTSNDEESKYMLTLNKGTYNFNSKHSDLNLTLNNIQSLGINATHTDITIRPTDNALYNYQLESREGKIFVPRQFKAVTKENNQSRFVLKQTTASPLIDIKTSFNTITIQ